MADMLNRAALFATSDRREVVDRAADWDRLAAALPTHTPAFSDVQALLDDPALDFLLVGHSQAGDVTWLALFLIHRGRRGYWLGSRRILSLRLATASLFGATILGEVTPETIAAMLAEVERRHVIDLFLFEDLPLASPLYALAQRNPGRPVRISHHNAMRRLIALPDTIAAYWAALRPSTRKAGQRDLRSFERLDPRYRRLSGDDCVTDFLPRAAALSAGTYQLGLGYGISDTADQRRHFARLAAEGRLFCYLAEIAGEPVAFAWGEISHGIFYFRMTGYDPALAHASAGKAILLHVIADLIDTKAASLFDFGIRDMDYKERFSTSAVGCAHVTIGRWSRPRSLVALLLDRAFDFAKTTLPALIGRERMQRIKRRLRG